MQKVLQRMTASQFQTVDDMVADFLLMFDNACKYNEPESLIYKVCRKPTTHRQTDIVPGLSNLGGWRSGNGVGHINKVKLCHALLVLGLVTVFGRSTILVLIKATLAWLSHCG